MTLRKQLSNHDISKIGLRMKSCRVLTMLNQEQFADQHNIPYTTIRNWEYGRVVPRIQGVNDFIESLRKSGVYVESDWILHGEGSGPCFAASNALSANNEISNVIDLPLVKESFSQIDLFKEECRKNKQIPVISHVNDDEMSPWFIKGDVLGGVLVNQEENDTVLEKSQQDKAYPVLVRCESGRYLPRWPKRLNGEWVFLSNQKFAEQFSSVSIALIRFHSWAFPRN